MPATVYGEAANIANLPRPAAAVSITSSTDATPIVVTTATAHGLQTGFLVLINGHTTNTNANGVRKVTVLSSTTYSLQTIAGANVAGNGAGAGAGGTSQSLALAGFNVPADTTDDIDATSVNVGFEALADMVAFLAYTTWANLQILAGGTLTTAAGSGSTFNGAVAMTSTTLLNGTTTINGATTATSDFEVSGTAYFSNLTRFRDPVRPSDADATLSTASGDVFLLAVPAASPRVYKLQTTTAPVPEEGERMLIVTPPDAGAGYNYRVEREDGTDLMQLWDPGSWALFQFEGGVWRGVCYSGTNNVYGPGW